MCGLDSTGTEADYCALSNETSGPIKDVEFEYQSDYPLLKKNLASRYWLHCNLVQKT